MGGYTVIQETPRQPSPGEIAMVNLAKGIFSSIEKERRKQAIEEAVKQHDLVPEIEIDSEGNQKIVYKKRESKEWKPSTMEEALALAKAKRGLTEDGEPSSETPSPSLKDTPKANAYNPSGVTKWGDVPFMRRVLGAVTPSSTPEEKNLGGLRLGGIFNPPQAQGPAVPAILQGAPPAGKSPYPEYPDAFNENGVWKVIRNGQKFRIEE